MMKEYKGRETSSRESFLIHPKIVAIKDFQVPGGSNKETISLELRSNLRARIVREIHVQHLVRNVTEGILESASQDQVFAISVGSQSIWPMLALMLLRETRTVKLGGHHLRKCFASVPQVIKRRKKMTGSLASQAPPPDVVAQPVQPSLFALGHQEAKENATMFTDGLGHSANEKGIAYYNNLIDYLLKKGIQPYVTLYHWDLPYNLHESEGGWLSEKVIEYFAIYAEVCFTRFGDRVKHWITINEPLQTAINGYSIGIFAPGRRDDPYKEPYVAAHHQILAHAAAVDVYRKKFKAVQGGEIGLAVDSEWAEAFSDKVHDKVAANRRLDFQLGWFLDPIFFGDYPAVMRERLGDHLPQFTQRDRHLLRNAVDFIGLNHYTTRLICHASETTEGPCYEAQEMERIVNWQDGEPIGERAASDWLYIVPWGLRKLLNYIAQKYKNTPIYITENGMDDEEIEAASSSEYLNDQKRVEYFKGYLCSVAQAIRDGVDVRGYFAWSLLDNFEWAQGYTKRFGLVYVDYKNGLTRHPKSSALWFSNFLKNNNHDEKVATD